MKNETDTVRILGELYRLLFLHPNGLTDTELSMLLNVHRRQVHRYRSALPGVVAVTRGRYTAIPNAKQVEQARAVMWRANYEANLHAADAYSSDDAI